MRGREVASRRWVALVAGAAAGVPLVLAGCGGDGQSTLKPKSHAAHEIATQWWVMLIGSAIVFALVLMALAVALVRRRAASGPRSERRAHRLVFGCGVVLPLVAMPALFGYMVSTMPATSAPRRANAGLTIDVIGHQWFWDVRYEGTTAVTANEIHIPVGATVRVRVRTVDVIHSFWVPELNRKIDMIPGKDNAILLRADRTGVYRGQCAEYCGLQHAHMALLVYADPPARFRAWLSNMARRARTPTGIARRGERVFLQEGCGGCHTIRGTGANGDVGPDLTHLASRRTIAADTLPNRKGYLGGWILDPQHAKPGNKMPGFALSGPELQALLDYLTSLK